MPDRTRIIIADDHSVVLEGISKALEMEPDLEIVGSAGNGKEVLRQVKALKPDIVILDISMPDLDGAAATREIKKENENVNVIIFTMYSDVEYVASLFGQGVSGYVLKGEPISDLVMAVKAVREGGTFYSSRIKDRLRQHMEELASGRTGDVGKLESGLAKLSVREREVFPLLADGRSVREIAKRLCISPKTVETHKYNIMEKLESSSIADLTKIAIKKGLIKV